MLSGAEARRIALAAQGFDRPPGLARVAERLQAIQIDSVNVLVRAHYLPAFSRVGPYPMSDLDNLAYRKHELFEYIGHAASLVHVSLYPLLRFRMEIRETYLHAAGAERRAYVDRVLAEVAERGPLTAGQLSAPGPRAGREWGGWSAWTDGKAALEWLWMSGRVAVSGRRGFERLYDLPERVIPPSVLSQPAPAPDDAKRELLVRAARALGVATVSDLASYFEIDGYGDRRPAGWKKPAPLQSKRLVTELAEEGRLTEVHVDGWREPAYMLPGTKPPRALHARALVSPFDSLIWDRKRTARLFGFDYRIEIYVPAAKRVHGYYVLPFLLGDTLVARVDLKADRQRKTLVVPGAFAEDGHLTGVASELAAELRRMRDWLGLERIEVGTRGDLAKPLARAVR